MIRPLRKLHGITMVALGVFLPAVFVVAIVARKPAPRAMQSPPDLVRTPGSYNAVVSVKADFFPKTSVSARLLRENKDSGRLAIAFNAPKDFAEPDLLVYWAPVNLNVTSISREGILLGSFGMAALPLPDELATSNGVLVLYSLADNKIVDVSKPLQIAAAIK